MLCRGLKTPRILKYNYRTPIRIMMGLRSSHHIEFQRSTSLRSSQSKKHLHFDMELFRIEQEITNRKGTLTKEQISDIKERIYFLQRDFDVSNIKGKYAAEFRSKSRELVEVLESTLRKSRMTNLTSGNDREKANLYVPTRKKRRAPQPSRDKQSAPLELHNNYFDEQNNDHDTMGK